MIFKTRPAHQLGNQARHCVRVANHRCAIGYYKTGRLTHGTTAEATLRPRLVACSVDLVLREEWDW